MMLAHSDIDLTNKINQVISKSQILFTNVNPYIPSSNASSSGLKSRVKISSNFKIPVVNPLTEQSQRSLISNRKEPILLIQDDASKLEATTKHVTTSSGALAVVSTSKDDTKTHSNRPVSSALIKRAPIKIPEPQWHAPWELSAVVSGHLGWVRSIAFDPSNEWFCTGSSDRTIKIWDFAKCCAGVEGGLKLTLTGHINAIRGLAVSSRSPYLFSAGEDKMVNCWDLEYNKIIRHYHGHLSGVFSLALHPTLDLLITGGRDSVARVWDIRTKHQIHVLGGHHDAVGSILTHAVDPQIITGSYDSTIKLWDLAAGKSMSTLTQHKKAVRGLCSSGKDLTFYSGSADNIKKWQTRDGTFLKNFSGHNSVVNCLAINEDGVVVSGGDNGSMHFWDSETGYNFQTTKTIVQPGSLDAEAGIFAMTFDLSGSRLLTCEADKTIKIWKENSDATEDSHPIDMKGWSKKCLQLKRF